MSGTGPYTCQAPHPTLPPVLETRARPLRPPSAPPSPFGVQQRHRPPSSLDQPCPGKGLEPLVSLRRPWEPLEQLTQRPLAGSAWSRTRSKTPIGKVVSPAIRTEHRTRLSSQLKGLYVKLSAVARHPPLKGGHLGPAVAAGKASERCA